MKRLLALFLMLLVPLAAHADDAKPDDMISLSLTTEGWVSTKTARVSVQVNASVSGDNSGTTRDAMIKAVNALGDGEWRLISFNRSQSDTGLENWYAQFENRLPETALNGIHDKVKKASKPGMQLTVAGIDFTPTLAENEAAQAGLRKVIMDMANAELKTVQAAFPDRGYRIAAISFNGMNAMPVPMMNMRGRMMKGATAMMDAPMAEGADSGVETSQKIQLSAQVTFAAVAPASAK
jgi:uncharacterized protein YggE